MLVSLGIGDPPLVLTRRLRQVAAVLSTPGDASLLILAGVNIAMVAFVWLRERRFGPSG